MTDGKGSVLSFAEVNEIFVCPSKKFWRLINMMMMKIKVSATGMELPSQSLPDMLKVERGLLSAGLWHNRFPIDMGNKGFNPV